MLIQKYWLPLTVFVLIALIGCGLFYGRKGAKQEPIKVHKAVEVETKPKPPPPGETAESGHWHGDEWHSEPHEAHAPAQVSEQPPPRKQSAAGETADTRQTPTQLPADFVNPTSKSSNPLFADGVPEHLQCPPEFIDVYRNEAKENITRKLMPINYEIREKWNPNRPIADVWGPMIENEKWYRENADPERAEFFGAAGRMDWLVQQWLDYPEIAILFAEDSPRASDMLRVEIGMFKPDWNAFTLPDGSGRVFRTDVDKKYVFTWGGRTETSEDGTSVTTLGPATLATGPMNGDPNAKVIEIDLNTISDEELEQLQGWNFNINPYTTGLYKLGDNR